MARPQLENGHTQIANEILEHLMRLHLAPNQWQVVLCIIRKTYGFHKKVDYIANSQIQMTTGLGKTVVSRAVKELQSRGIISRNGKVTGFQKDWEQWKRLAVLSTSEVKEARKVEQAGRDTTGKKVDKRQSESHKSSAWQVKVFHRDNLTCRICSRDIDSLMRLDIELHAHHIKSWASHPELRFEVDNGLTMCDECHWCYHYADERNNYKFMGEIMELKKLAELITIERLAVLHQKVSSPATKKVSSPAVTQKIIQNKLYKRKVLPPKKAYGEFGNVLLTDEEYQKLKDKFGDSGADERIENLSRGIASKGYKYKSHYATILNWDRREIKINGVPAKKSEGQLSPWELGFV